MMNFDSVLGIHELGLAVRSRRAELIAANLANADTPGYKARDVDFASVLAAANGEQVQLVATDRRHIVSGDARLFGTEVLYRNPNQPALDGNTVDTQLEEAEFMKNAMQYQASLEFINRRIQGLHLALRGE
jgi:flagellar basal-body rod protein FlgB